MYGIYVKNELIFIGDYLECESNCPKKGIIDTVLPEQVYAFERAEME